jgi:hypothetical protein
MPVITPEAARELSAQRARLAQAERDIVAARAEWQEAEQAYLGLRDAAAAARRKQHEAAGVLGRAESERNQAADLIRWLESGRPL